MASNGANSVVGREVDCKAEEAELLNDAGADGVLELKECPGALKAVLSLAA